MESGSRSATPLPKLALGALGVVFGDIGTSPLYAMRACLLASGDQAVSPEQVLGILSLIFWALALTITVKYVGLVLRVDNRGEGGVLALTALSVSERTEVSPALLVALGLAGCALFFGDGSITPAVSVLGAIEGLSLIEPGFSDAVVPLAAIVLLALFWIQKRGTGAIGGMFGPIMLLWFLTLAILGIHGILRAPQILAAINPYYAVQFIATHGAVALAVIGGVFLAVTGGEALYADLGHFGRKPIQLAWLAIVWPGLLLNYFGQGALLLTDPEAMRSPFYMLAPPMLLAPLVVLATAAAIIASQAVISGVFSLTQQALQLGFLPRVRIEQTSAQAVGQVYVPAVNWMLCLATLSLVLLFQSSDNLTNAYGIAVASTMVIESLLLAVLLHSRRAGNGLWPFLLLLPLLLVDVTFFLANAHKIPGGGWFPLLLGSGVFMVMRTWQRGRAVVAEQTRRQERSLSSFLAMIAETPPVRVDGTAVFLTSDGDGIPRTLSRNVKYNGVLHEHTILLTLSTERIPRVPRGGRLKVAKLAPGLYRLEAHLGFMEQPDVPRLLRDAERLGLSCRVDGATYFLGRDDVVIGNPRGMTPWRKHLFLFLSRNAQFAGAHFGIPPEQIIEIGGQVQI